MQKKIKDLVEDDIFYAHNDWYKFKWRLADGSILATEYNSGLEITMFIGDHIEVDTVEYCQHSHENYSCELTIHKGRVHQDKDKGRWIKL